MIMYRLPILILLMSILYIFIIPEEPLGIKLLFKLIPMAMIIFYAIRKLPGKKSLTHWLILIGLFFSMIGDGTLHWFVVGLSAFLIGHLFYMTGFFAKWNFSVIRFLMIVPIAVYGFFMGSELLNALKQEGNDTLIIPVLAYIIVISLMAWSAVMTGNKWVIMGSILFVISDSILAWNMFVAPVNFSGELIMSTYYGAQFLIAHSLGTIVKRSNRVVW
ncbi:lysoplasmalogenase [Virgibacillus profundi]|uniref:Lysoplasmalogenase n=1 Tax=Virgibacillus profundi TaxID=2024555 RepID=A0A2A2IIH2_9BACI|nr:lysoplasmalogenase [Virgibacillus profundi]PAV31599.1 lysoplasmalogenase [Virgibacillus profundi]PXY55785.1 lysoplasmalogenase [Virgibacillus profundi]